MAIVPIINIKDTDKEQIKNILNPPSTFRDSKLQEKTSEVMYLLFTNKNIINKAKKTDNLLIKFCGRR